MQIRKIRFKNINSLKGEHAIDFEQKPLSSAGLFAITGPTGSGKTTILDVITLALFSRIPRVSEAVTRGFIQKSGLVVTRNMKDALAEVTYSCNDGTFISQWSISTNRNGNLRDYEMQISDVSGSLVEDKRSEVPARNEAHIGLSFEQFVKAIILAQGDFAAFLKAKKDERGRLLEKVTGTWIYRELGKAAFQKNKELGQQLELLQSRETALKSQLMPDEEHQALLREIEQSDKLMEACQSLIEQLKGQEKLKGDIANLGKTIEENEAKLVVAREKLDVFWKEHGERMEKHARLQPHQKKLWDWKSLGATLKEQGERLEEIDRELLGCANEDQSIAEEVKGLTGSDKPVAEALEVFQNTVIDLQRRLAEAETLQRNMQKSVLGDAGDLSMSIDKADPDVVKKQVADALEANKSELERLTGLLSAESRSEPQKKLGELRAATETLQSLISETGLLKREQKQLEEGKKEAKELGEEVEAIPGQLEKVVNEQKQAEMALQGLQKDKTIRDLTASLEEHRNKLVAGEPCPLCGATEHPFSEGVDVGQDELEEKIEAATGVNDGLKKRINTLESALSIQQKSLKKLQQEIWEKGDAVNNFTERINKLRDTLPHPYRKDDPATTLSQVKQEAGYLESYMAVVEKSKKLNALAEKISQWGSHYRSAAELSDELKGVFTGKDVSAVTRKFHNRITRNSTRQKNLLEEKETLSEKHHSTQNAFQRLNEQLTTELSDYHTPAEAIADLIDDGEYASLQLGSNQLKQEIDRVESGLRVHQDNLKTLKDKDADRPLQEIQKQRGEKEEEYQHLKTRRDELIGQQNLQNNTLKELAGLQQEISAQKKQNEKWVLLNKYIGDSEGKRFSTFAQELTLLQLVQKANQRLKLLNDRYMLGLPLEGEDDSLVIIDSHMGDMRRSVKSLSGGETFLVSLSLALALSDLAAHKVKINSLFIDEGFGSLDKLTLDQTMDTLEKLQYETNKTIGVISHVEAMQERITTQVKLEKGGQGHSTLLVAG